MKILFVGGHRSFEAFRAILRGTCDENHQDNMVRWANHDQVLRGLRGPIHVVYDKHYMAAGSLNMREEDNIRTAARINEEMAGGTSSRNDPHQIDRRGHAATAAGHAGDGREANPRGDVLDGGITASRYNDAAGDSGLFGFIDSRPLKEL